MVDRRDFTKGIAVLGGMAFLNAGTSALALDSATAGPVIATSYGKLSGATANGIHHFLGIPYAKPPIGPLRWAAPQPPESWRGIRPAKSFSNIAPQAVDTGTDYRAAGESEDCLYLNVWTRTLDKAAKQPVMVWIHGGGNLYGAASHPMYDGEALARKGVTLVSFNYRLGVFGFLSHPIFGGNFAVLDYVAALKWVKANIANFGGDPDNVTIFGQSAGAVAVRTLLASPPAAGLFHRGIIESAGFEAGAVSEWWSRERNQHAATELFSALGTTDPGALRGKSTAEIMAASKSLSGSKDRPGYVRTPAELVWMPVIDGKTVVAEGYPAWGKDVPVMLGTVENEARLFLRPERSYDRPLLERMTAALAGPAAPDCIRWFDSQGMTPYEALDALVTTVVFTEAAGDSIRQFAAQGRNIRYYHFTRRSPGAVKSRLLAAHAVELPYIFGTLSKDGYYDSVDVALADALQDAWISFARTGEASGGMAGQWPRCTTEAPAVTVIGDTISQQPYRLAPLAQIINATRASGPKRSWLGETT